MSWVALGWASQKKPGRVADKMVLIALADRHNEDQDLAWPSLDWLCDFCCLDRKTVIAALDRLQEVKLISDSGHRAGKTKQIKAYRLDLNDTENTIPKAEQFQKRNAEISGKEYRKRDTEPSKEPSKKNTAREISEDWKPEQFGEGTKSREIVDSWDADELKTQIEHFRAHHRAHGSKFSDWQDAWTTWALNSRRFGPRKDAKPIKSIPAATDTERIKALEGKISLYERLGRDTELPPLRRELATLKAKVEGIAA